MKNITLIIFIISCAVSAQTKYYTLSQALESGLQNSKDVKIANSNRMIADSKISEINAQFYPKFLFNAGYTRLSDAPPFEVVVPLSGSPMKLVLQEPILNVYNLKLSAQQPLFTGFRLSSLKYSAEQNKTALEYEHQKEMNETAYKICCAFWNYYKTKKIKENFENSYKSALKRMEDAENFYAAGFIAKNDLLKYQIQKSNIELKLLEADNAYNIARALFNQSIGEKMFSNTEIIAEDIIVVKLDFVLDEILNKTISNRFELKAIEQRSASADYNYKAAKSGWLPSVYLSGSIYYSRPNSRIMPARDEFKETWEASIVVQWEILNWGQTSAASRQALEMKIQTEILSEQLKEAFCIEAYQSYLSLIKAIDKVALCELTLKQAEENNNLWIEKFNNQIAASADVIDAENEFVIAKNNLCGAMVEYELAKLKLKKSMSEKIY